MKVTLIDSTANPVEKLIFTKNTRLNMTASRMEEVKTWTTDQKISELEYMANTIKSSWEFVNFTFSIEGVTRAFTHQLVRNRQGSYAQQTMRILDMGSFEYVTGPSIEGNVLAEELYHDTMATIDAAYRDLIGLGAKIEDARGLLPTNICTNIVVQYNLRTLSELAISRASPRTQGEFREVLEAMISAVLEAHPWAEVFLADRKMQAASMLDAFIEKVCDDQDEKMIIIKLVDLLRKP
jgi:flavin-dependent thymidylate synthase